MSKCKSYVPILMYHQLINNSFSSSKYAVNLSEFKRQMKYLFDNNFTALFPQESEKAASGHRQKFIMITFDDGFKSDLKLAAEILSRYNFKAISFITTNYVGKPGYLSWEQITILKKLGFQIQSHTKSHPLLTCLDSIEIRKELESSKAILEEKMGIQVNCFSFPGGNFNKKIIELAKIAGYQYLFTSYPGANSETVSNPSLLNRVLITKNTTIKQFVKIVDDDKKYYWWLQSSYFAKKIIEKAIGINNYHYLWKIYNNRGSK